MPGYVGRDSIASCKQNADLFDEIRGDPYSIQMKKCPPMRGSKDAIESLQQKIEREQFEVFKANNFRLPKGSFVVIGTAGKYLFFVVMLPPYIFLYGIPKWLLTQATPAIYEVLKKMQQKLATQAAAISSRILSQILELYESLKASLPKFKRNKGKSYKIHLQRIAEQARAISEAIAKQAARLGDFVKTHLLKAAQSTYKAAEKIHKSLIEPSQQMIKAWTEAVQSKISHLYEKTAKRVSAVNAKINAFVQPYLEKIAQKSQQLAEETRRIANIAWQPIQRRIEATTRSLQPYAQKIASVAQHLQSKISENIAPIALWLGPVAERAKDWIKFGGARMIQYLTHKAKEFSDKIWQIAQALPNYIRESIRAGEGFILQLPQQITSVLPSYIARWVRPPLEVLAKSVALVLRTVRTAVQKMKSAAKIVNNTMMRVADALKKGARNAKQAWKWAKPKLKTLPKKLKSSFINACRATGRGISRFIFWLRQMFAWTRIIFRYSMQLVREAATEAYLWLPFRS